MDTGTILRIERISPYDGPGLRTVVFFKGCSMRCAWCSTPESQTLSPQLYYIKGKCLRCGYCVEACPQSALAFADDTHELIRNENTCTGCFACASACPARAIGIYGKIMSLEDVMRRIRRDEIFYHYSGGGVTLSGGDVLCQADFARNILKSCKEESIGTTAELDMYGSYDKVSMLMAYLDSYYVDIKWLYDNRHREWTGVSGAGILDNIRRSSNDYPHKPLYARMPLIPGVNDSMENIRATVRFCASLKNCRGLEFLPYHRLGVSTYAYIGRPYRFPELPSMTLEEACSKIEFLPISALPFEITISGKRISG